MKILSILFSSIFILLGIAEVIYVVLMQQNGSFSDPAKNSIFLPLFITFASVLPPTVGFFMAIKGEKWGPIISATPSVLFCVGGLLILYSH